MRTMSRPRAGLPLRCRRLRLSLNFGRALGHRQAVGESTRLLLGHLRVRVQRDTRRGRAVNAAHGQLRTRRARLRLPAQLLARIVGDALLEERDKLLAGDLPIEIRLLGVVAVLLHSGLFNAGAERLGVDAQITEHAGGRVVRACVLLGS